MGISANTSNLLRFVGGVLTDDKFRNVVNKTVEIASYVEYYYVHKDDATITTPRYEIILAVAKNDEEVRKEMSENLRKIPAIKRLRYLTLCSLREAKTAVEEVYPEAEASIRAAIREERSRTNLSTNPLT